MSDEAAYNLTIEDHDGRTTVVPLPLQLGAATIGRLQSNTVHLDERNVSRRHARLSLEHGQLVAEDLDSYNGLWVNGERIDGKQSLRRGDALQIGDFRLSVQGDFVAPTAVEATQRSIVPATELAAEDTTEPGVPVDEAPVEATSIVRATAAPAAPAIEPPTRLAPAEQRASLLCVSTEFAGNSFELMQIETIIGRVEDNDIAIDHRSVSRQHARIVLQAGRHRIIDLHSANGTLVNGEAYAETELKHGDLIELGHVRLRFAAPNQAYAPTAEEQRAIAGLAAGRSRGRLLLWAAAALLAVLLPTLLYVWGSAALVRERLGLGEPRLEALVAPPGEPPALVAPQQQGDVAGLLAQARLALTQHQWPRAETLANAVLALDPGDTEAPGLVSQALAEQQSQRNFDRAIAAAGQSQWSDAWNSLQEINKQSSYAPQAAALLGTIRPALLSAGLTEVRAALQREAYDAAAAQLDELEGLEPGRHEVAELRRELEEARRHHGGDKHRAAARPRPARAAAGSAAPPPAPPQASDESGEGTALQAYTAGLGSLRAGNLGRAIDEFNRCVVFDANYAACYRALGITYAKQGNAPRAVRYYRLYLKTEPQARDAEQVRQLLQKYEGSTAP